MKHILLLLVFLSSCFSSEETLAKKFYIDKSNSLSIEEILQDNSFFQQIQKYSLGIISDNIWIHIPLKNNSNKEQNKRVYNQRAGLDFVDAYIIKDNKIIKSYKLGDMRKYENRDNIFRISFFDLKLQVDEKVDIYIKQKAYSSMDLRWYIHTKESFDNYYNLQGNIYSYISGLLTVTAIISLVLFLFLKNKYYLIYSIFTFGIIIYQLSLAGFFYQFEFPLFIITLTNFPFPMIMLCLLCIFPFYFFEIKKGEFKYLLIFLKFLITCQLLFSFIEFFYFLNYDILYLTKYTTSFGFLTICTLLILSIKTFLAKKRGSLFYLLANIMQFSFISIYLFMLMGIVKYTDFYNYTLAIGSISQDIFLSIALIYSTYLIKKENDTNQKLLNEYSKLSFIGQSMVNISHQWKAPINNIFNSINHIEVAREFNDPKLEEIVNKNIKNIKDTTIYLKDTAFNQLNFYKEKKNIEEINIYNEITNVINFIENEFRKKDINIQLICDENLFIEIEKNYLFNVLMILFENSFKIFEKRKVANPIITLDIKQNSSNLEIIFEDNAGGTSKDNIGKLFDKNYTDSNSTGIGLYLAKEIVIQKFKGEILVENSNLGLLFKIKIDLNFSLS